MITPTKRFAAFATIASFVVAVAILANPSLLPLAAVLLSLAIAMYIHIQLTLHAVENMRVEPLISASSDREPVVARLRLVNGSPYPVLLAEYSVGYEPILRLEKGCRAGLVSVPSKGFAEIELVFSPRVGEHYIGPLTIVVRDPLGLFRSSPLNVWSGARFRVAPSIEPAVIRRLYLYTRSAGLVKARRPGEGIEFYDVRDYTPGDELRRVVWRVYASRRRLAVWEAERESMQTIVYIINSSRDMWIGVPRASPAEHSARIVASIARYAMSRGYLQTAVAVNECGAIAPGSPAFGRNGFERVMQVLTSIKLCSGGGEISWLNTLNSVLPVLPRESSFIFIFTRLAKAEELAEFVTRLRLLRHKVFVVVPMIATYDIASTLPRKLVEVYRAKQLQIVEEELKAMEMLRTRGVDVVALDPSILPQRLVQIIEARL